MLAASRRRQRPFRSAFAAQVWYEWNCHGLMLNGFVARCALVGLERSAGGRRHGDPNGSRLVIRILLIVVVVIVGVDGSQLWPVQAVLEPGRPGCATLRDRSGR